MRRSIIELGNNCMVVSLPIKWIKQNNLKKGMELEVEEEENKLVFSNINKPILKEAYFEIKDTTDSGIRTVVVNAYRIGYDKINIKFKGKKESLKSVVDKYMLGFELFTIRTNEYVLESVAEPGLQDFDKIVVKQLQIINEMLDNIGTEAEMVKIRKYDNFLKRVISKYNMFGTANCFMWQFLTDLTHIAVQINNFAEIKKDKKLHELEIKMLENIRSMYSILESSYLSKNAEKAVDIHDLERKTVFSHGMKLLQTKNPITAHHLILLARTIYLATSPLAGWLQTQTPSISFGNQSR